MVQVQIIIVITKPIIVSLSILMEDVVVVMAMGILSNGAVYYKLDEK